MDPIEELARRAARRVPLFPDRSEIVECAYWTAANGYRHLVGVVKIVNGRRVEEQHRPPYEVRRWLQRCQAKRDYYRKCKQERGEKWSRRQRELKALSRKRLGHN